MMMTLERLEYLVEEPGDAAPVEIHEMARTLSSSVERIARALERFHHPEWDDAQFEIWWNHDPRFISKVETWFHFQGTLKELRLKEAAVMLGVIR